MTNSQRLTQVRKLFLNWMVDSQGSESKEASDQPEIRRESVLIRDEFYCGRRFHADLYDAIWFIEEDVLKIYRSDGSLVKALRRAEIDAFEEQRVVAVTGETVAESSPCEAEQSDPEPHDEPQSTPSILKFHDPLTLGDANQSQDAEDRGGGGNQDDGENRRAA